MSLAGSPASSSGSHSAAPQAAAGPAAAAATAAAQPIDNMEELASSLRALTLVTANLGNALERLSRQAMQLETQFHDFGLELAKMHEEVAAVRRYDYWTEYK